jgi:hypothetical protein
MTRHLTVEDVPGLEAHVHRGGASKGTNLSLSAVAGEFADDFCSLFCSSDESFSKTSSNAWPMSPFCPSEGPVRRTIASLLVT